MRLLLTVGALAAAVIIRKQRQRSTRGHGYCGKPGTATQLVVQAWPAGERSRGAAAMQCQQLPPRAVQGSQQQRAESSIMSRIALTMSPSLSSSGSSSSSSTAAAAGRQAATALMLAAAMTLALTTLAALVLREQTDLAIALVVAWLLAAARSLLTGAGCTLQDGAGGGAGAEAAPDAVVLVDDACLLPGPPPRHIAQAFHGTWIKDAAASESMDAAMRLIHLNPLMRQAVKLIRGVQLRLDEHDVGLRFAVFSAISWFKITETFPWSGELHENRRRDMRRGGSRGRLVVSPKGTLLLHYDWGAPHAGRASDEFSIDAEGRLRLTTVVHVGAETAGYVQVYRRKAQRGSSSGGGSSGAGSSGGGGQQQQLQPEASLL